MESDEIDKANRMFGWFSYVCYSIVRWKYLIIGLEGNRRGSRIVYTIVIDRFMPILYTSIRKSFELYISHILSTCPPVPFKSVIHNHLTTLPGSGLIHSPSSPLPVIFCPNFPFQTLVGVSPDPLTTGVCRSSCPGLVSVDLILTLGVLVPDVKFTDSGFVFM